MCLPQDEHFAEIRALPDAALALLIAFLLGKCPSTRTPKGCLHMAQIEGEECHRRNARKMAPVMNASIAAYTSCAEFNLAASQLLIVTCMGFKQSSVWPAYSITGHSKDDVLILSKKGPPSKTSPGQGEVHSNNGSFPHLDRTVIPLCSVQRAASYISCELRCAFL